MALRLALYAEGVGDAGGEWTLLPPPGVALSDEHLGAAHVFARTAMTASGEAAAVDPIFVSPLRTSRGRYARGSDLFDRVTLRRLLTWADPKIAPSIAIVLVDQDGESNRKQQILEWTRDLPLTRVIAVPIPEFEAWLLADEASASKVLGRVVDTPPTPERLERGGAKQLVGQWTGRNASDSHDEIGDRRERELRRRLAEAIQVDRLLKLRSFEDFISDCRTAVQLVSKRSG